MDESTGDKASPGYHYSVVPARERGEIPRMGVSPQIRERRISTISRVGGGHDLLWLALILDDSCEGQTRDTDDFAGWWRSDVERLQAWHTMLSAELGRCRIAWGNTLSELDKSAGVTVS